MSKIPIATNNKSTAQHLCITKVLNALWLKKLPDNKLKISIWDRPTEKELVITLDSEELNFLKEYINNEYGK